MKKLAILVSLLIPLGLSSQAALAEIKAADPSLTKPQLQEPGPAWLGVWIEDVPVALGKHLSAHLKENQGVLVKKVTQNSPASRAGLQDFDIISHFNDQEIFTREQLTRLVRSSQADTSVKLSLIRNGKLLKQDVVLETAPQEQTTFHRKPIPHPHGPFSQFGQHPFFNENPRFDHHPNMPSWGKPFFNPFPDFKPPVPPSAPLQDSWSEFESIQIESTGNNKHRATIKHKDSEGNTREFVYEGSREEIRDQILKQEEMDDRTRQNLLQALDMNNPMAPGSFVPPHRMRPDWFNRPFSAPPGF